MRLWVVCQYYPPETGAPSARLAGLARNWRGAGADVTVLTGLPNHPDGVVPPAYQNRPPVFEEDMDGIAVRRHWLYVAPNKGKWPRLWNQLSFAASVLWHNWKKHPEQPRPDVVIASSPSFFCVISAWLLARRNKAKFIFEVRDLWPAIFLQMGILRDGVVLKILEALEMFLYRRADAVVTVTRSFARNIISRGIPAEKLAVVYNGVSEEDLAAAAKVRADGHVARLKASLGLSPLTKVVLYIGNHGQAQALGQVIDAARLLVKRTDVVFLFVGSGADKDNLISYAKGVPNVQFLPAVKHDEVWTYYALGDINMVCLKNIPDFEMFIPSKMFEIMAAQSAAVAALRGEGAEIMQASGGALVVPSEEPEKLAAAIATLLDDPARRVELGAAGRKFVEEYFGHGRLAAGYLALCQKLTATAKA